MSVEYNSFKLPYCKCENPKRIRNKYGDYMVVPCGHCRSCLIRRCNRHSYLCDLELKTSRYGLFITLTYDNDNVPKIYPRYNSNEDSYELIQCTERLPDFGSCLTLFKMSRKDMRLLQMKFNLKGYIPVLSKLDVQLFFKRLRSKLSYKYGKFGKKIVLRYYIVGEYGPVHYRPHYHILLYFEDRSILEDLQTYLRQSWQFGDIQCDFIQGSATSYVSSYVTSYMSVPSVLKLDSFKPFCSHSFKLGQRFFTQDREYVYSFSERGEFDRVEYIIDGVVKNIRYPGSLASYYFPKCRGYSFKDDRMLFRSYTLYSYVFKRYGIVSPSQCARLCTDLFFCRLSLDDDYLSSYISYAMRDIEDSSFKSFDSETDRNTVYRYFYHDISISKHFLEFVCNYDDSYGNVVKRLNLIKSFWKFRDYKNLINMYSDEELLSNCIDSRYLDMFYDTSDFYSLNRDFKSTNYYMNFSCLLLHEIELFTKHKKLNDLNERFNKL